MLHSLSKLHTQPLLRKTLLPLLKRLNPGDISIRHHYTGERVHLHSFRHKGYWFHGKNRELETMQFFASAIRQGDTVLEVGGHIGYLSLYFASLVGERGRVVVFEPGTNNLPYIRKNLGDCRHAQIVEKAVSQTDGIVRFYEEPLTGQNNSLLADYSVYEENCGRANATALRSVQEVQSIRIDTYVEQSDLAPNLIKIDIEGAELDALLSGQETIKQHLPIVMVEVTEQKQEVLEFFFDQGYRLFLESGAEVEKADELCFNAFALHTDNHAELAGQLLGSRLKKSA